MILTKNVRKKFGALRALYGAAAWLDRCKNFRGASRDSFWFRPTGLKIDLFWKINCLEAEQFGALRALFWCYCLAKKVHSQKENLNKKPLCVNTQQTLEKKPSMCNLKLEKFSARFAHLHVLTTRGPKIFWVSIC